MPSCHAQNRALLWTSKPPKSSLWSHASAARVRFKSSEEPCLQRDRLLDHPGRWCPSWEQLPVAPCPAEYWTLEFLPAQFSPAFSTLYWSKLKPFLGNPSFMSSLMVHLNTSYHRFPATWTLPTPWGFLSRYYYTTKTVLNPGFMSYQTLLSNVPWEKGWCWYDSHDDSHVVLGVANVHVDAVLL